MPLPLWAGAEALQGFSGFWSGARERGALGGDWWEGALDRLRAVLESCGRPQGFVLGIDGGAGYGGIAYTLLRELEDECRGRPRLAARGGVAELLGARREGAKGIH